MKVVACGDEVIVSMSRAEWIGLTNHQIGDYYGNGGTRPDNMPGIEYDLTPFLKAIEDLRVASEVKRSVINSLGLIAKNLERAYWPISEFRDTKATQVKK